MLKMPESRQDNDVPLSARRPTVHGVYDYWLGGGDHLREDRELGKAIEERFPSVPAHVRAAREFHLEAARWCAARGVTRFVCTGISSWKPGVVNVRGAALGVARSAEAAYVHRGVEPHARARATLMAPQAHAVRGRVEFPAEVLSAVPVAEMIAGGEPVGLHLGMTLHFAPAEAAAEQVRLYAAALPPGSVVVASVALADHSPRASELLAMFTPAAVYRYTAADVTGWLTEAGLRLVPPGLCDVTRLAPGCGWERTEAAPGAPGLTVGALGVRG